MMAEMAHDPVDDDVDVLGGEDLGLKAEVQALSPEDW